MRNFDMYFHYQMADNQIFIIRVVDEGAVHIPSDLGNRHYQDYLAWLEAGNIPEPWQPETTVTDIPVKDVIEDGD